MRAVLKIGGSILRDSEDLERLVNILKLNSTRENVLVVSALNGVTDMLLEAYAKKQDVTKKIKKKHDAVFSKNKLEKDFEELSKLLLEESEDIKRKEKIASFGERLSAKLIAAYLTSKGFNSIAMTGEECGIVSDGKFENAACILNKTKENFKKKVIPKITKNNIVVITGYYGIDENNNINTFGRGGSDYSAGVVALAVNAQKLEIWKNVEGFMTADPLIIKNAKKLEEISFEEARELGYLGAQILHPRTLDVLDNLDIPTEIKNVYEPTKVGTRIIQKRTKERNRMVSSIVGKKDITLVNVKTGKMINLPGFAAKIFEAVAKKDVSIDMIATSQVNISFTIENKDKDKVFDALRGINEVFDCKIENKLGAIGVVGEGISTTPEIAAKVFGALANKNIVIRAISQSASGVNITFIINEKSLEESIRTLHEEFKLGEGGGRRLAKCK